LGVGLIIALEKGKFRVKVDPPGSPGYDISFDFEKSIYSNLRFFFVWDR